jgi:hypothetical protein
VPLKGAGGVEDDIGPLVAALGGGHGVLLWGDVNK